MLDVVALQQRQFHRTADTIVGTQCGTFGSQPLTINVGLDGVVVKVNLIVHQFVTHHIHVALQDNGLTVLHTWRGRFTDNDIARLVNIGCQSVALAPLFQVGNHFLFTLRRAWNLVDLRKLFEDYCWF